MKSMVVAAAVLFTSLSITAQTNTSIVHQDGIFAQALAFTRGTSIDLNVSRGTGASGQAETFLFFDIFQQTSDDIIDTFASGQIPDGSLQGDDPAHVVLDVDTSQLTNFISSSCTFSFITFTETCGPAPCWPDSLGVAADQGHHYPYQPRHAANIFSIPDQYSPGLR